MKKLIRITGNLTKIQTGYLLNTNKSRTLSLHRPAQLYYQICQHYICIYSQWTWVL